MPRSIKHPGLSSPVLTRIVTVRFEPEEYAYLQSVADERHLTFSGLLRRICLNYPIPPQRTPQLDGEAVRELNRIGCNLNQVAHSLNRIDLMTPPSITITVRNYKVVLTTLQLQLQTLTQRLQ